MSCFETMPPKGERARQTPASRPAKKIITLSSAILGNRRLELVLSILKDMSSDWNLQTDIYLYPLVWRVPANKSCILNNSSCCSSRFTCDLFLLSPKFFSWTLSLRRGQGFSGYCASVGNVTFSFRPRNYCNPLVLFPDDWRSPPMDPPQIVCGKTGSKLAGLSCEHTNHKIS